jgi:hypothetical protein
MALDKITLHGIEDNAVTSAKIGVDVIVADDIAANAITVAELQDGAVSHAKLHNTMDLSSKTVTLPALSDLTVTGDITVDTSTLKVDSSNNRVGMGTASPSRQVMISRSIADGSGELGIVSSDSSTSGALGNIHFGNSTDTSLASIRATADGATDSAKLEFNTEKTGAAIETAMSIDSNGFVLKPFQPGFSVRQQAQGGIDCSSTDYIAFRHIHTTFFNTGNHFNSSTGMFTAPVAGNYVFGAAIRYDSFTGNYQYGSIYKNSSTLYSRELTSLTGNYLHLSIHCIMNMSANDTCHVALRNSGDSSINLDNDCNFYGYLLG